MARHRFESGDMSPHSKWAFSLVELLVVITIIVVLLALLAPALDKAIYQAELAVCGANQKGLAAAITVYAMGSRKRYPYQAGVPGRHHTVLVNWGSYDMRPILRPYLSINKSLHCPLSPPIDMDGVVFLPNQPLSGINANYSMWFGWQWQGYGAETGMFRIGDRFSWTVTAGGQQVVYRFDLLSGDVSDDITGSLVTGSHPDGSGLLHPVAVQNGPGQWGGGQIVTVTYSWWEGGKNSDERGVIDRNFSHADGSVSRLDRERYGNGAAGKPWDPRLLDVPQYGAASNSNNTYPARKTYLPKG